jgi:pimeloyl-ACP methyl ester carboxylesterase
MNVLKKLSKITLAVLGLLALLALLFFGYQDIPLDKLKEKYAPAPSKFVSINGMEVHFRDEGPASDSIPIVLLHGTGSSLHTFDAWVDALKTNHRVLRMDLPGYGLTGPFPNRDYSMQHYVGFIDDFLKTNGIKRCILGGNSLGGGIAWRYALEQPDRVTKLILIDASGYPVTAKSRPLAFELAELPLLKHLFKFITPKSVARASIKNVYADKSKVTEALVDRYFELTLRAGNRQAFVDRLSQNVTSQDFKNIVTIQQATLIIWGDKDELIPVNMAYRFKEDIVQSELVILENVGHLPMEEAPKKSLQALKLFLD